MDTARYHPRPRRLVLLVSTFLALLAQPAAWAEGVVRKAGAYIGYKTFEGHYKLPPPEAMGSAASSSTTASR